MLVLFSFLVHFLLFINNLISPDDFDTHATYAVLAVAGMAAIVEIKSPTEMIAAHTWRTRFVLYFMSSSDLLTER